MNNFSELLAQLRNRFHAYLLTCKHCKQFQEDCWQIIEALEREIQIQQLPHWKPNPKNIVTERDLRRAEEEQEND